MFNSVVLDVFIGLSLIFLLYSLMATTVQEILAQWFGLRGRMLQKAIRRMLDDELKVKPNKAKKKVNGLRGVINGFTSWFVNKTKIFAFFHELCLNVVRFFAPWYGYDNSFAKAFFESPSIKYLGESTWRSRPSYIDAPTFSQTILYMLRGDTYTTSNNQMDLVRNAIFSRTTNTSNGSVFVISKETQLTFKNYYADSGGDVYKFKASLESWYNQTMQRANGWYKKQTQTLLFIVGLFIAVQFNVDSIKIYEILSKDKVTREQMVELAIKTKDGLGKMAVQDTGRNNLANKSKTDDILFKNLDTLKIAAAQSQNILGTGQSSHGWLFKTFFGGLLSIVGWLITAIAIMLGAPFWFDLLNKLISLRSAGGKPGTKGSGEKNNNSPPSIPTVG